MRKEGRIVVRDFLKVSAPNKDESATKEVMT